FTVATVWPGAIGGSGAGFGVVNDGKIGATTCTAVVGHAFTTSAENEYSPRASVVAMRGMFAHASTNCSLAPGTPGSMASRTPSPLRSKKTTPRMDSPAVVVSHGAAPKSTR